MTLDRFIGIPFREHGRDIAGCDCWGLVCLVYRELRGIELPTFSDQYVSAHDRAAIAGLIAGGSEPWREIPAGQEQAFDAVKIRRGRDVSHVGLVVEPGLMLDVISDAGGSRIQRYRDGALVRRVAGFFRYEPNR